MPSFPDLHDEQVLAGAPTEVAPADVLARVKAEGLRRRTRRHRRNGVLAALGIALLAVPAVALLPEGGTEDVTVAADGDDDAAPATTAPRRPTTRATTATTAVPPATTVVSAVPAEGDDVGLVPPLVIERESPVTTVPACRNSTDPACGEFRWDPAPAANQPVSVTIAVSNPTPVVGEEVVVTVTWSDPDAPEGGVVAWPGKPDDVNIGHSDTLCRGRHGAWAPPEPSAGSGTATFRFVYEEPGSYTIGASAQTRHPASEQCGNYDPYGSVGGASQQITVTAASA